MTARIGLKGRYKMAKEFMQRFRFGLMRDRESSAGLKGGWTCIVFSRDRPAQLELLLKSRKILDSYEEIEYKIIFKATTEKSLECYRYLEQEYEIDMLDESKWGSSFKELVLATLSSVGTTCCSFMVDDDVWIYSFDWKRAIERVRSGLSYSTRLGKNIDYSYMNGKGDEMPRVKWIDEECGYWELHRERPESDWGYKFSLDGDILLTSDLLRIVTYCKFNNPNQLEANGQRVRGWLGNGYMCGKSSALVNIANNKVQEWNENRCGNGSAMNLVEEFAGGRRIDWESIKRRSPFRSVHIDIGMDWE